MKRPRPLLAALVQVAALLPVVALLGGCELTSVTVADAEDVIIVEAILRPGLSVQKVFVYRTITADRASLRVDSADVRVVDADGTVVPFTLTPEPSPVCASYTIFPQGDGGSCYTATPAPGTIRPGAAYTLEVELADGRRITGSTTIPGDFAMLQPAADTCVMGTPPLDLVWSQSEGAWAYEVSAALTNLAEGLSQQGVDDPPDQLDLTAVAPGQADTARAFPTDFIIFDRLALDRDLLLALQKGLPAGSRAEILVSAADRNYVNWVRGGDFNPSGQVRVPSVTGDGTGVFGSLVVTGRTLLGETDRTDVSSCQ